MKLRTPMAVLLVALATAGLFAGIVEAANVTNGDFGAGNLSGWTTFVTTDGTIGTPSVVSFNTTGSGGSYAARLQVGRTITPAPGPAAGGGIYQTINTAGGPYSITVSIAIQEAIGAANASCGVFELLVDGVVVDSHDFVSCAAREIERSTLSANGQFSGGSHEIRIKVTRTFLSDFSTPYQYIDNVVLNSVDPGRRCRPVTRIFSC